MQNEQKTVFISYSRKSATFIARAIFQDLRKHRYDVFMDVVNTDAGETFEKIIRDQIKARAHFLVILTAGTVQQFEEPNDFMRSEIEYAIEVERNIVPLLIDGFKFDRRTMKYMTGKLAVLPRLNGLTVPHEYFDEAMKRLRTRFLKQPIYVEVKAVSNRVQDEAERKIEEVAAQPPPTKEELSAEDYFNRALEKYYEQDIDGAINDSTIAIEIEPSFAEAYNRRGVAQAAKGNIDNAIADFNQALQLDPELQKAYINRGIAHQVKGDFNNVVVDNTEAIRLNPQYAGAYINRGNAHQAIGNLNEALADFTEAIRLDPQEAIAYNNRGNVYMILGNFDSALSNYNEAIRLNPSYAYAYFNRAFAFDNNGNFKEAIADYQKYLDLEGEKREGDQTKVEQRLRDLQEQLNL